jgi:hypothetical protein
MMHVPGIPRMRHVIHQSLQATLITILMSIDGTAPAVEKDGE